MKIAIPAANGMLCPHFGHCETFAIIDIDADGTITAQREEIPPPHEPGVLPQWLRSLGVEHVVAGGMGARAQELFKRDGITVTVGAHAAAPDDIARAYATGALTSGDNLCDH